MPQLFPERRNAVPIALHLVEERRTAQNLRAPDE
jgi:hypothetical protein